MWDGPGVWEVLVITSSSLALETISILSYLPGPPLSSQPIDVPQAVN